MLTYLVRKNLLLHSCCIFFELNICTDATRDNRVIICAFNVPLMKAKKCNTISESNFWVSLHKTESWLYLSRYSHMSYDMRQYSKCTTWSCASSNITGIFCLSGVQNCNVPVCTNKNQLKMTYVCPWMTKSLVAPKAEFSGMNEKEWEIWRYGSQDMDSI